MSLIAKNEGKDFEITPAGNFVGRCYQIVDLGWQTSEWNGERKNQHKVRISFELPTELMKEGENAGRPFSVSNNYTVSLHEKSNLRKALEAWRGKKFSDTELEGFELDKIIGLPCMIQVIHNEVGDKTYANISSIASLPAGVECPEAVNPQLVYDNDKATEDEFQALPEWLRNKINRGGKSESSVATTNSENPGEGMESDIPF